MELACINSDPAIWDKVGSVLVEVHNRQGDLVGKEADYFSDFCPDDIFLKHALAGPGNKFGGWFRRANRLMRIAPKDPKE